MKDTNILNEYQINFKSEVVSHIIAELNNSCINENTLTLLDSNEKASNYSYSEIVSNSICWTSLFQSQGFMPGDRLIVIANHSLDLYTTYLGAILGGFVPVMVAPPSAKFSLHGYQIMLKSLVKQNCPKAVIITQELIEHIGIKQLDCKILTRNMIPISSRNITGFSIYRSDPQEVCFIQYSSGTTGLKKGVEVSNMALVRHIKSYCEEIGLTHDDCIVSWLPLYHDMGLITSFFLPLLCGIQLVSMSAFDWVRNPAALLRAITRYRATLCWLPNFSYNFLANRVKEKDLHGVDLSSIRGFVNCSEPISFNSQNIFTKRFSPYGLNPESLKTCYAMAETTFAITSGGFLDNLAIDTVDGEILAKNKFAIKVLETHPNSKILVSSGKPIASTTIAILDEDFNALPERRLGEIAVKSPSLMKGYFENLQATIQCIRNGWFMTGDIGYLAEGNLYVSGRKKDIIIHAGKNIFPQDVEEIVNNVHGVIPGRCVSFGVMDEKSGTEQLVILAETLEQDSLKQAEICEKIFKEVIFSSSVYPWDVQLLSHMQLLKSTSGKISRNLNKDLYLHKLKTEQEAISVDSFNDKSIESRLRRILKETLQGSIRATMISADMSLITSGLVDSLSMVELILKIEKEFDILIPTDIQSEFYQYDSIVSIATLINELTVNGNARKAIKYQKNRNDRVTRVEMFLHTDLKYDALVLGSSRTMAMKASILSLYNKRGFNMCYSNGRLVDSLLTILFVLEHNTLPIRVILIGIDLENFVDSNLLDSRTLECPYLEKYFDNRHMAIGVENGNSVKSENVRFDNILQNIRRKEYWQQKEPGIISLDVNTGDMVNPDVSLLTEYHTIGFPDLRQKIMFMQIKDMTKIGTQCMHIFERMVSLFENKNCIFIGFRPSLHCSMLEFLKRSIPKYEVLIEELNHNMQALAGKYSFFKYFDTLDVSTYGGDKDNFVDGAHLGNQNSDKLMLFLLKSIDSLAL